MRKIDWNGTEIYRVGNLFYACWLDAYLNMSAFYSPSDAAWKAFNNR